MVTLKALVETYSRFGDSNLRNITIKGSSNLSVIKKFVDEINCYEISEEIEEEGMSFEDVIERLDETNGDGSDCIFTLTIDGKEYINLGYSGEEVFEVD